MGLYIAIGVNAQAIVESPTQNHDQKTYLSKQLRCQDAKRESVVRRLTVGPTGQGNPARDSNPESPDFCFSLGQPALMSYRTMRPIRYYKLIRTVGNQRKSMSPVFELKVFLKFNLAPENAAVIQCWWWCCLCCCRSSLVDNRGGRCGSGIICLGQCLNIIWVTVTEDVQETSHPKSVMG